MLARRRTLLGRTDRFWTVLIGRRVVTSPHPRRLYVESLESRLVPAKPPVFDYGVWGGALGSVITLSNQFGEVRRVADHLSDDGIFALATFDDAPEAFSGYNVYNAHVVVPAGYSLSLKYNPIWVTNPGGNYVTNATAYADRVVPSFSAPSFACAPGAPTPQPAAGNDNRQALSAQVSPAGVRYADGSVDYSETDLVSDGFASPWGRTRSYSQDRLGQAFGQHNGNGWVDAGLPVFRRVANDGSVSWGGRASSQFRFDTHSDRWQPVYAEKTGLSKAVPGELSLTDEGGNRFVFNEPAVERQGAWHGANLTDSRLVALPPPAAATDRTPRHWYNSSALTASFAPTDTARHRVRLYMTDFDNGGRSQRVEVLDAAGAVLDTRTVSGFSGGVWLTYDVSGPVRFRLTRLSGPNATLAAVLFDAAPASGPLFVGTDTATKGDWRGVYGADGYHLPLLPAGASPPPYATLDVSGPNPRGQDGQLKQFVAASGEVTTVTQYSPQGLPAEVRRQNGSLVEAWQYAYTTDAYAAPLIRSVTLTRSADNGVTWQPVRSVEYHYYSEGPTPGDLWGSLQSAVVHDGGLTGPTLTASYYRYYKPGEANGDGKSLKFVVTGSSFDRMAAAHGVTAATASSLTDEQVAAFADRAYRYDAQGRVTQAVVQGDGCSVCGVNPGQGAYTYAYTQNPNSSVDPAYPERANYQNKWRWKTAETRPDGNTSTVYSSVRKQTMLRLDRDVAAGLEWRTYTEFDGASRVLLVADTAAVTAYSETSEDLVNRVNGNAAFLSDTAGRITEYEYAPVTTAAEGVTGEVAGYLEATYLRHGETARRVPVSGQRYTAHTANGATVYPVAATTTVPAVGTELPTLYDDFSTPTPAAGAGWTATGAWVRGDGVVTLPRNGAGNPRMLIATDRYSAADQEIVASFRAEPNTGTGGPMSGVRLRTDPANPLRGISLIVDQAGTVKLARNWWNDSATATFAWQPGTWYRFRLRVEGGTVLGKVWAASDPEPAAWTLRKDGWTDPAGGYPALIGGTSTTVSFDDVAVSTGLAGDTTTFAYTWNTGAAGLLAASVAVTAPVVTAAQHGSGTAGVAASVLDAQGRPVWVRDGAGFLHYLAYDPATGAVVAEIEDVDTTRTGDFAGLPPGWATPAGGGAHLTTTYQVDKLGRATRVTRPTGAVDHLTYDDAAEEVRVYPGWTGTSTTGPVQIVRRDRAGGDVVVDGVTRRYGYTERLTMTPAAIPVDAFGRPTGAEPVSNLQTLTREYVNQSGQLVWHDDYFDLAGLTHADATGKPLFTLGVAGVNFLRTTYGYAHNGMVNRVQTPDGTVTRTVYDGLDRVVSEWRGDTDTPAAGWWSPTNPAGLVPVRAYEYDTNGNLTKLTEMPGGGAADRVTQTWYDWRNRPVAVKAGVQATEALTLNRPLTYLDYDNQDRVTRTRVFDGDGVTPVDADADGVPDAPAAGLLRGQTLAAYDTYGRAYRVTVSAVDQATGAVAGTPRTTDYWYDQRDLVVKTARPGGLVEKAVYDGAGRLAVSYFTDGGGDLTWADALTVTGDVVDRQAEYAYDGDGNTVQVTARERVWGQTGTGGLGTPTAGVLARVTYAGSYYDAAGRLTATVDVGTNGAPWVRPATAPARSDTTLVTSFTYDAAGRLYDTTDPSYVVYRTATDALGRVVTDTRAVGTSFPWTAEYVYDAQGRLQTVTVAGDRVTRYGYDNFGRVNGVTRADGTPIAQTALTAYNRLGEVVSVTAPGGTVTQTAYDAAGRPVSLVEAAGTSVQRTTGTAYDTLSRVVGTTDPAGKLWATAYDDLARTVTTTDPLGHSTSAGFDLTGNRVTVTDARGKTTTSAYDRLGRIVSVTDPLNQTTSFEYVVTGDRDVVQDASGNRTQTVFDPLGRTAQTLDPLGKATVYTYDRLGRPLTVVDRLGRTRAFTYDALGQTLTEDWYAAGSPTVMQTQTFTYDLSGNLTSAQDPDGSYTLTYDKLDRVSTVAQPFGLSLTFGYDAAGNRAGVADNQGGTQASVYDALDRPTTRTLDTAAGDARLDWSYTPLGGVDVETRSGDLAGTAEVAATRFGYDLTGRVTGLTHTAASGATLADYGYTYDGAGRLTQKTEDGTATAYGYDDTAQLTQDGATGFGYDATGNRTTAGYATTAGNRLQSDGTWAYTYDAAGQVVRRSKGAAAETWTYGYDLNGQAVWAERRATDGGTLQNRVEYRYDAFGNRLQRVQTDGAGAVAADDRFAHDGWNPAKAGAAGTSGFDVWADLSGANAVTTRRLFGDGVDELLARAPAGGAATWYLTDLQGSVRQVVDGAAAVVGSRDYAAFGAVTAETGAGLDRYGYTAREWDATLGLQYTRARLYDPLAGRFLADDPLGLAGGDVNTFRYAGNAVTMYTDPSGLVANWAIGAGVGMVFGGVSYAITTPRAQWSLGGGARALAVGGVSGAVAGGTFGASLAVAGRVGLGGGACGASGGRCGQRVPGWSGQRCHRRRVEGAAAGPGQGRQVGSGRCGGRGGTAGGGRGDRHPPRPTGQGHRLGREEGSGGVPGRRE